MSSNEMGATLGAMYRDHHRWLLGWLHKRLGNAFDAADLAQDTFMRILLKNDDFRVKEPRALLTTIAQGIVANLRRRQEIERSYLDALALMPEAHAPSPESRMIILETLVALDRMLSVLPALTKEAFLLSQLEGLRQIEIAERLNISVPTVKRHVARALEQCCFWEEATA